MKKQTTLVCAAAIALCLFCYFSCANPPKNIDSRDGNTVYSNCSVAQVVTTGVNLYFTRNVEYNSNNDPVNITGPSRTGDNLPLVPDISFRYDNSNRLVEFAVQYTNGSYQYLHRYGYDQNRIALDSEYRNGPVPNVGAVRFLRCDDLNRIAQDSSRDMLNSGSLL